MGGAAATTRGMRVPLGGPLDGPPGWAWEAIQLAKKGVDEYGKRMKEGEERLMEYLDTEKEIYNRQSRDCIDSCIFNKNTNEQCMKDCDSDFLGKSADVSNRRTKGGQWAGWWFFPTQEKK